MNQRKEMKMKRKVYWLALLAGVAIVSQTQGHGFGGGGAGFGGGHFGGGHVVSAPVYHAAPMRSSAPNRAIYANHYATYNRGAFTNRSARNRAAYAYSKRGIANINRAQNLPSNWRNHVYAQHSANWHHDWDRSRDHWWNGHRCRFINGSWVIFDVGFDPGWWWSPCPGYYYGYPCDDGYYGY
jgi:hypothetical protein